MKKKSMSIAIITVTVIILLSVLAFLTVTHGNTTKDESGLTWYYTVSGGKAYNVYLYSGTPGETLTIPSTLDGYEVAGIRGAGTSTSTGTSNRRNILNNTSVNYTIKNVVIPETVTSIGANTFANFAGLQEINIPSEVTSIGWYAYYNCNKASNELFIPDKTTTIGQYAFDQCSSVSGIHIGNGVTSIESYTFGCNKAKTLTIGNKVTTIKSYAFRNNSSLEGTIVIPDSVTTIQNSAFASVISNVEKIEVGKGLVTIPTNFFNNISGLKEIDISADNTKFSSEDGVLFDKTKTKLMCFPRAKTMESYEVPSGVTSIDSNAFLNTTLNRVVLPEGLISIGSNAFSNAKISGELVIPNSVTTIDSSAFSYCSNLTGLKLGDKVATIGSYAFQSCTGMSGDLTIPDSVTTLGSNAFSGCTSFDGILTIGTGLTNIQNNTFQKDSNFKKAIIGSGVTTISYGSFEGFSDIWINNISANVSVNENIGGNGENPYIHWLDDTHKVTISTVPGVQLINADTNEVINSGDYMCETSFNYKVKVEEGYNYPDLKLIEINNDDTENFKSVDVNTSEVYTFDRLIRTRTIYVQNLSAGVDLSLRTFITEVNRANVEQSRAPVTNIVNGSFEYLHTKYPVIVKTGNLVTYKIRVYNEGITAGKATKVSMYIPEGLEYDSTNKTNTDNGWYAENGKISTTYLSDKEIKGYNGNGSLNYEDIDVVLKVTKQKTNDENTRLNVIAEIAEESAEDADSTPGSITSAISSDYKEQESYNSTTGSYIRGQEDDDDFENVLILGKIKVEYGLRINKIDTDTKELLSGAKFNLLNEDEEVIKTEVTDENGVLDFGTLTTYGEGEDVYYIEEAETPNGYISVQKSKIKITVVKTIIDENAGTYSVSVVCDLLDYYVDTTRYEFTPVKTAEQLQKMGSGEVVTIDGVDYQYNTDTNYKLMNDIDLSGIEWTPISDEMKCIIDGDNHKISNLTITPDADSEISEIGLFKVFSGIVENVEFENVSINIPSYVENPTTQSGFTGVGAIAGVMKEGYIRNCKLSGSISSSKDNVGGFVGHTLEGKIVKVQNCVNNANISTNGSNAGGLIGCALGAVSVTDCTNNGKLTCDNYNAGGLVGYVKASNYNETEIKADFDDQDKKIDLVVENKNTKGQYSIVLENIDGKTLGLVSGAVYKVLDKNKNVISGLENVSLENGTLKLKTVDIETLGVDTYYIKEITPASGYEKLDTYIKLSVRRYWDGGTERFKVSVETENLTDDGLNQDVPDTTEDKLPSKTGEVFTKVNFANVSWNSNKAEFKDCTNTGAIEAKNMNAAGIVGTSHCITEISNCENTGNINSALKSGGILSELKTTDNLNVYSKFKGCTNSGEITSDDSGRNMTGSAGGIISHAMGSIKVNNCTNTGRVTSSSQKAAAGIVADINGQIIADYCENTGDIVATSGYGLDGNVGGIVGKNIIDTYTVPEITKEQSLLKISNSKNHGNIISANHLGGIVGYTTAATAEIENCSVTGNDENKVNIIDVQAGDKGGILGLSENNSLKVSNCYVSNVIMERTSTNTGNTYGATGGIIGNVYNNYGSDSMYELEVLNCTVNNSKMTSFGKETAGIIGLVASYQSGNIKKSMVSDCNVNNCQILNDKAGNTYGSSAGVLAVTCGVENVIIKNCNVENSSITSNCNNNHSTDMNVGGVIAISEYADITELYNCDVKDTNIINNSGKDDSCANTGGIVAAIDSANKSSNAEFSIVNCNWINGNMTAKQGNAAGILGWSVDGASVGASVGNIKNCNVKGCNINSEADNSNNSDTAGIVAISQKTININNCNLSDSTITGKGANVAGILAVGNTSSYKNNTYRIMDCHVYNTDIKSEHEFEGSSSCNSTAGLVAYVNSNLIINNCTVEKGNDRGSVIGKGSQISGGIAGVSQIQATDCSISGINIECDSKLSSNYVAYRSISGFLGSQYNTTASENKLQNITVKDVTINGASEVGGGIFAYMNNPSVIENCTVSNLNIKQRNNGEDPVANGAYDGSFGGIGGIMYNTPKTVRNNNISNSTIDVAIQTAGGLFGSIISGAVIDNCNVESVKINNPNIESGSGYANSQCLATLGGLVGYSSDITIKNSSNVKNSNITVGNGIGRPAYVAGMLGFSKGNATIDGSKVIKTTVTNETTDGIIGGYVAMVDYKEDQNISKILNISNSSLEDCNNITGKKHVGGILGFGRINANNITISDSTIEGLGDSGDVGGVVGNNELDSTINGVTATNINVSGKQHVGGIAGYSKSKISNVNISESTISGTNSVVGGIVGNVSLNTATIDNCNVDKCDINNQGGIIGGVAGFANTTVSECSTTNSNITVTDGQAYIGGIVGLGGDSIVIENSSVRGNTITGTGTKGDIIGAPDINLDSCTIETTSSQEISDLSLEKQVIDNEDESLAENKEKIDSVKEDNNKIEEKDDKENEDSEEVKEEERINQEEKEETENTEEKDSSETTNTKDTEKDEVKDDNEEKQLEEKENEENV